MLDARKNELKSAERIFLVILILVSLTLLDINMLFLFKNTEQTTATVENLELNANEYLINYEVDSKQYSGKVTDTTMSIFEIPDEIEILYNVNNPDEVIAKGYYNALIFRIGTVVVFAIIMCLIKGLNVDSKIYKDPKVKVVEGEIFDVVGVNNSRVFLKHDDRIYTFDSMIKLDGILERLQITKLPIYIYPNGIYKVDTREIEKNMEVISEKYFYLNFFNDQGAKGKRWWLMIKS